MSLTQLTNFAQRYAEAWCSPAPDGVAGFYAENGYSPSTILRPLWDEQRSPRWRVVS